MNIKQALQLVSKDRAFLLLALAMVIITGVLVVTTALNIKPSELPVPVRFSSFSVTRYHNDRWYYLISFAVMGMVMAVMHILIALKLYTLRGRSLALLFLWIGLGVVLIAAITIYAVFRVVLIAR